MMTTASSAAPDDTAPNPTVPSAFKICEVHQRALDDLARMYPPAIERSLLASGYLEAIAQEEAPLLDGAASRVRCPACAIGKARVKDADDAAAIEVEAQDVLVYAIRCSLPPSEVPIDSTLE